MDMQEPWLMLVADFLMWNEPTVRFRVRVEPSDYRTLGLSTYNRSNNTSVRSCDGDCFSLRVVIAIHCVDTQQHPDAQQHNG